MARPEAAALPPRRAEPTAAARAPLGAGQDGGAGGPPRLRGLRSTPGPAASSPAEAARRKRGCVSNLNFSDFNDSSADLHKQEKGWAGVIAMRRAARTALQPLPWEWG